MRQAVTHVAFYAGWSKATKAIRSVTRVLGKQRSSKSELELAEER